jgi:hypothetical protein
MKLDVCQLQSTTVNYSQHRDPSHTRTNKNEVLITVTVNCGGRHHKQYTTNIQLKFNRLGPG